MKLNYQEPNQYEVPKRISQGGYQQGDKNKFYQLESPYSQQPQEQPRPSPYGQYPVDVPKPPSSRNVPVVPTPPPAHSVPSCNFENDHRWWRGGSGLPSQIRAYRWYAAWITGKGDGLLLKPEIAEVATPSSPCSTPSLPNATASAATGSPTSTCNPTPGQPIPAQEQQRQESRNAQ